MFRAISLSVVHGMLAGMGRVLIAGQIYALADREAPASGTANVAGLPALAVDVLFSDRALIAVGIGARTVLVMTLWKKLLGKAQLLPGPLVAVGAATLATAVFDLPTAQVEVSGLVEAIQPPSGSDLGRLAAPGLLTTVVSFL